MGPHDKLFRTLLKNPRFAEALLREKLPRTFARNLLGPPELLSEHFIDKKLKTHVADAVLRARLRGGKEFFVYVIIEHKRQEKPGDLLQLAGYLVDVYRWLLKKHGAPLPPVIPLIIYNGSKPWRGPVEFRQLLDKRAYGWRDTLNFKVKVLDVGRLSIQRLATDAELKKGLLVMKTPAVPLDEVAEVFTAVLRATRGDTDLRQLAYHYYDEVLSADAVSLVGTAGVQYQQTEEPMMQTWSQQWLKQGEKRGEKRGARAGSERALRTFLKARFGELPPGADSRLKRASLATLERLTVKAATAKSAAAVFQDD